MFRSVCSIHMHLFPLPSSHVSCKLQSIIDVNARRIRIQHRTPSPHPTPNTPTKPTKPTKPNTPYTRICCLCCLLSAVSTVSTSYGRMVGEYVNSGRERAIFGACDSVFGVDVWPHFCVLRGCVLRVRVWFCVLHCGCGVVDGGMTG